MRLTILFLTFVLAATAQNKKLLVVSVDGLDNRYLADCDKLGLKIPNMRRLIKQGQWAQGVVGVVPTVTWPSHTTIISGVDPTVHGIAGNKRPKSEGGDYYWDASLLKAKTLLDAMKAAGRTTAAVTWPVTVNAPVTYNLPEYFQGRRGGDMDTRATESKAVPVDLVARIAAMYPSFPQHWMEDRTRTLATLYLLKTVKPDLILVHLVNLDAEAHDNGPFTREANAMVEHIDDLIGQMLAAMPVGYSFVLTSDHGFELVTKEINLMAEAKARGVVGVRTDGSIAIAETPAAAALLKELRATGKYGLGREIAKDELARFSSTLAKAAAVYDSAPGYLFDAAPTGKELPKVKEGGSHGHWPMRYRSVYVAWGPGISAQQTPEISIKDIAGRMANILGLNFTPGAK